MNDGTIRFALGIWAGQDEQLARRLQHLLIGAEAGFVPYHKPGGAWQIDSGNNWLLRIEEEEGQGVLQCRYPSAKTTVQWAALCTTVGMLLDVKVSDQFDAQVTLAFLRVMGWDEAEIGKILEGPAGREGGTAS